MTILAFLQNPYFLPTTPERYIKHFQESDDFRRRCLLRPNGTMTGKRLTRCFGDELCASIIWDEATMRYGNKSSDKFPADVQYMQQRIDKIKPCVILVFGNVAKHGIEQVNTNATVYCLPHPAARVGDREFLEEFLEIANKLKETQ